jgi:hypothetical protein
VLMASQIAGVRQVTLGGDKNYDTQELVRDLRGRGKSHSEVVEVVDLRWFPLLFIYGFCYTGATRINSSMEKFRGVDSDLPLLTPQDALHRQAKAADLITKHSDN